METLAFYILLFIHLVSLVTAFGSVIVIDTFGLAWMLRLFNISLKLVQQVANITQRLIWLGFFGLVLSGIPMLVIKGNVDELTQVKLFFVVLIGLNGIFLHRIKKMMEQVQGENLPKPIMFRMGLASFISQLGWWSAVTIGFLHRHWRHHIPWPDHPWILALAVVGILALVWFTGERLSKEKTFKN